MVRLIGVAAVVCLGACYNPRFHDCEVSCASGDGCPDGLSCDSVSKKCTTTGTSCPLGGSADAATDTNSASCWPFTPSNFDPCATSFPPTQGSLSIENNSLMQDTNSLACDYTFNGHNVCLIHVTSVHVASTFSFSMTGSRPMIIVSDGDVIIDGEIDDNYRGTSSAPCNAVSAIASNLYAGGGGGGGGGTAGGNGGAGDNFLAMGGSANADTTLVPLTLGCTGGAGGSSTPALGGIGGVGGGAIQISSKTMIHVSGGIYADGAGGAAAQPANNKAAGGGGGGAGGSILLEAMQIDIPPGASVCAVGGGGGTASNTQLTAVANGQAGVKCTAGAGGDPAVSPLGGKGGGGISGGVNMPYPGLDYVNNWGGGGGGAANGRIRVRTIGSRTLGGLIVPAPSN